MPERAKTPLLAGVAPKAWLTSARRAPVFRLDVEVLESMTTARVG